MWYGAETPTTLSHVLLDESGELARFALRHLPRYAHNIASGWFPGQRLLFGLFALWAGLALAVSRFWARKWPVEAEASLVLVVTSFLALLLRPISIEVRYLNLSTFVLCAWLGCLLTGCVLARRGRNWWLLTPVALFLLVCVTLDLQHLWQSTKPYEPNLRMRELVRTVARSYTHGDIVATDHPYFWAYYLQQPALAPAVLPSSVLVQYMSSINAAGCYWSGQRREARAPFARDLAPAMGIASLMAGCPSLRDEAPRGRSVNDDGGQDISNRRADPCV